MGDICKYDIDGFMKDLGLNLEEVSDLYSELINEINLAIAQITNLINKDDLQEIQKIIHNIKGVTGNYRITDLYTQTTKIYDLLKSESYNDLQRDLKNLINTCNNALKEIQNYFSHHSILIYNHQN